MIVIRDLIRSCIYSPHIRASTTVHGEEKFEHFRVLVAAVSLVIVMDVYSMRCRD